MSDLTRLSTIPRPPDHRFVGREDILKSIDRAFETSEPGEQGIAVVHGPAGIGKTQIALKYAERALEDRNVFWVKAHRLEDVAYDYCRLAKSIRPREPLSERLNLLLETVKRYLESPASGKWLLIFDDMVNEQDDGSNNPPHLTALWPHLPRAAHGRLLFCSRDPSIIKIQQSHTTVGKLKLICVEPLSALDCTTLYEKCVLERMTNHLVAISPNPLHENRATSPQNVVHIAAYVMSSEQWEQAPEHQIQRHREIPILQIREEYMAAETPRAWKLPYSLMVAPEESDSGRLRVVCRQLLDIMSLFHYHSIPKFILQPIFNKLSVGPDAPRFSEAIDFISKLALISTNPEGDEYDMSITVRESIYDSLTDIQRRQCLRLIIPEFCKRLPALEKLQTVEFRATWSLSGFLLAHAASVATAGLESGLSGVDFGDVCLRVGIGLYLLDSASAATFILESLQPTSTSDLDNVQLFKRTRLAYTMLPVADDPYALLETVLKGVELAPPGENVDEERITAAGYYLALQNYDEAFRLLQPVLSRKEFPRKDALLADADSVELLAVVLLLRNQPGDHGQAYDLLWRTERLMDADKESKVSPIYRRMKILFGSTDEVMLAVESVFGPSRRGVLRQLSLSLRFIFLFLQARLREVGILHFLRTAEVQFKGLAILRHLQPSNENVRKFLFLVGMAFLLTVIG